MVGERKMLYGWKQSAGGQCIWSIRSDFDFYVSPVGGAVDPVKLFSSTCTQRCWVLIKQTTVKRIQSLQALHVVWLLRTTCWHWSSCLHSLVITAIIQDHHFIYSSVFLDVSLLQHTWLKWSADHWAQVWYRREFFFYPVHSFSLSPCRSVSGCWGPSVSLRPRHHTAWWVSADSLQLW